MTSDPVLDTDSGSLFHFSHRCIVRHLGDLLVFLKQLPTAFYEIRRNDRCRQGNELTTVWDQFGGHADPDKSENSDSNPESLLAEATKARAAVCMGIPMGIPMGMGMGWVWGLKFNPHGSPDKSRRGQVLLALLSR